MSQILKQLEPPGRTPAGHVVVQLTPDEYKRAWAAGIERMVQNLAKQDAPDYRNNRNAPEHIAQPLAVLCEAAVSLHLFGMFDWGMAAWDAAYHDRYKGRADVGDSIEVKRVKYETGMVSVNRKDVGKGLYLFVAYAMPPEFLNVKILGWLPYDEAWDLGTPAKYGKKPSTTKRVVEQRHLRRCTCFDPAVLHPR